MSFWTKLVVLVLLCCGCQSTSLEVPPCRVIYNEDQKYCSVSFYELLADAEKYDGYRVRLVGYLKHDSYGTVLSPDKVSLEGTMILENMFRVIVSEEKIDFYQNNSGNLVVVFGVFSTTDLDYPLSRAEIRDVSYIYLHI